MCDYQAFIEEEEESKEGEEEEEESGYLNGEEIQKNHLVADIIQGGEALLFLPIRNPQKDQIHEEEEKKPQEPVFDDSDDNFLSVGSSPTSEIEYSKGQPTKEEISIRDIDAAYTTDCTSDTDDDGPISTIRANTNQPAFVVDDKTYSEQCTVQETETRKVGTNLLREDKYLVFQVPQVETKKFKGNERDNEHFCDSCTVGSTSKSSSEWRSSINFRDSGTDDPFSSSSRRSCLKWESYTLFQKYDEEMLFLDRISAQKLHETESLKSLQVCQRSVSQRIIHKLATSRNKKSFTSHGNPYNELEAAYVAQICLTWEALNWNYKNFQALRASWGDFDRGCPAKIAQQFQQFQVLLQRYIENEPYERGRRPEVYARMRSLAPKLLQVPEFRDSEDDQNEDDFSSRIPSTLFLMIMEESIRTFMNFLKADREKHCQLLAALFRRNRKSAVDPTLLRVMKKANKKKKKKLNDLRGARKCLRKIKLKEDEEIEILMGLIDLKVVSRVLRMTDISGEHLHWCDEKMTKVRVAEGKLNRDSSPLFFPAH